MSYFEDFEEDRIGDINEWEEYECYYTPIFFFEILDDKWKTKDGEILNIEDMTTAHIINCLNLILRKCSKYKLNASNYPVYINLKKELDMRNKIYE